MNWRDEIIELHDYFQQLYLAEATSLDRAEAALHPDFTFVGPDGSEADRSQTLAMLEAGIGHSQSVVITTSDHTLLAETDELVVASYREHHQLSERSNERLTTVVFVVDPSGPNGVRWLRVHECWLTESDD